RRNDRQRKRQHARGDIVGEKVTPLERPGERRAPVHVAAGDRLAHRVVVLVNRLYERQIRRGRGGHFVVQSFAVPPAVIARATRRRLVVHLLVPVLTDVGDQQRARS